MLFFAFARVFVPKSVHGEAMSVLHVGVTMQSLLEARSVSSVKCTLIPMKCHFSLY